MIDTVALIDADMLCYRIGFACDKEDASVAIKTMDKFVHDLIDELHVVNWELHLTGKGNFRNDYAVTVPYKGNRAKLKKPQHLETLRQFLLTEWDANLAEGEEADDTISIRATELGDDAIIVSLDKDFDQVQGWHYNFVKKHKYYITEQEGLLNFYMQFLTGDRIDNILGVKGIGPVKALKILTNDSEDKETSWFNTCADHLGYERAVENGRLLYLRRKPDEIWEPPCTIKSSPSPSEKETPKSQKPSQASTD